MFEKDELDVIRPELPEGTDGFFSCRTGGVSSGPWGGPEGIMGLNVGTRVGDNAGCVRMNRMILAQLCPGEPRWLTQVHGIRVVDAESVTDDTVEADASVSVTPGVVCAVQVADCLPVLVAEKSGRAVAAVHAGWRSLAGGVIEAAVKHLRERLADPAAECRAWLGPRIGFDDFETADTTATVFRQAYPEVTDGIKNELEGHAHVSLAQYALGALARVGVTDVVDCGLSTVTDPVRFYSYRRDGEKTGRHAALIWVK